MKEGKSEGGKEGRGKEGRGESELRDPTGARWLTTR